MKNKENSQITATQLAGAQICMHAFYLDSLGDRSQRRGESDGERQTRQDGLSFEDTVVRSLGTFREAGSLKDDPERNLEMTRSILSEAPSWVRHAYLKRERLSGIPDLLQKFPGRSAFGDFTYIPVDIKNRKYVTVADRLQLMAYAHMLEPLLGHRPERGIIWLNTGEQQNIYLSEKLERQFFAVLRNMSKVRSGDLQTEPVRMAACNTCQWNPVCRTHWEKEGHISMLSGIGKSIARRLLARNIRTCADVAKMDLRELEEITELDTKKTKQMQYAAIAQSEKKILQLRNAKFPQNLPIYYYDIETLNDNVFLHGIIRRHGNDREEKYFFADRPDGEEDIWHQLLDYVSRDEKAVIYCWTTYEYEYVSSSWEKFGGNKDAYRRLMKGLQDQCAFVKDHFVLPCRGY